MEWLKFRVCGGGQSSNEPVVRYFRPRIWCAQAIFFSASWRRSRPFLANFLMHRFYRLHKSQVELMGEGSPVIAAARQTEKPSQQASQPPSGSGNNASPSSKTQSMKQQPSVPKQQAEGNMQEASSTTGSSSAPLPKRRNKRANKAASEPHQGQEASKGVNGGGPSRAEVPGETKNQGVIDGSVSRTNMQSKCPTCAWMGVAWLPS